MEKKKVRIVHYINQFFAGIGGEEKADVPPGVIEKPVGPGMALQGALKDEGEIVATVYCGDSYFGDNLEKAQEEVVELIRKYNPDVVITGPAFNAGRYGTACGAVAKAVTEKLGIPVISGMYPENPGYEMYRQYMYCVKTGASAATLRQAVGPIVKLALKAGRGEEIGTPEEEGYMPKGIRKSYFHTERGAKRAVDMLVAKLRGEPFKTELPMPVFDRVPPAPPVADLSKAVIALVTSGGIVPKGNPDRIEASSASKYGKYSLCNIDSATPDKFESCHGGYDRSYANENPNRVLPVDVMRELEKEGVIGKLHDYFYATVGNGTSVANAKKFANAIGQELKEAGVHAIIVPST